MRTGSPSSTSTDFNFPLSSELNLMSSETGSIRPGPAITSAGLGDGAGIRLRTALLWAAEKADHGCNCQFLFHCILHRKIGSIANAVVRSPRIWLIRTGLACWYYAVFSRHSHHEIRGFFANASGQPVSYTHLTLPTILRV